MGTLSGGLYWLPFFFFFFPFSLSSSWFLVWHDFFFYNWNLNIWGTMVWDSGSYLDLVSSDITVGREDQDCVIITTLGDTQLPHHLQWHLRGAPPCCWAGWSAGSPPRPPPYTPSWEEQCFCFLCGLHWHHPHGCEVCKSRLLVWFPLTPGRRWQVLLVIKPSRSQSPGSLLLSLQWHHPVRAGAGVPP